MQDTYLYFLKIVKSSSISLASPTTFFQTAVFDCLSEAHNLVFKH